MDISETDGACTAGAGARQCMLMICWAVAFLLGSMTGPVGATVHGLVAKYGLSLTSAGLIPLMMGAGRLITAAGSGWISDILGRRPVMAVGCVVIAAGAVTYALSGWWWLSLGSMLAIGLGVGLLDVAANAAVADLSDENRQSDISRLQAWFGVGSVVAPVDTAVCISSGLGWEPIYLAAGLGCFALLLPLALCPVKEQHPSLDQPQQAPVSGVLPDAEKKSLRAALQSQAFVVLIAVSFLYGGLSRTVLAWTNTYLAGMDVSPLASMYPIILYNVGIAIGRFSSGSVIRWSYRGVFIVGSIGAMISTVGSVVSDGVVLTALSLALAGLAHAALFPTAVAWGSELLPDNIGTSTGLLSMAVAAGSMVIPWLTGAVSDIVGLRLGILSVGIVSAAAMVLSVLLAGVRQSGAEHSDERALGA